MIAGARIQKLANNHLEAFQNLKKIETELNERFYGMDHSVLALALSAASAEPMLFIGPPGTAKSNLIRTFCHCLALYDLDAPENRDSSYFEYLLTKFTEPGELFGFFKILNQKGASDRTLTETILTRDTTNMMQEATVVYLDEVFNASGAILNSILAFMNERTFHDRGERVPVAMKALFGATNDVPKAAELKAIYDRFLIRCHVTNLVDPSPSELSGLFSTGWKTTHDAPPQERYPDLLEQLEAMRNDLPVKLDPVLDQPKPPGFIARLSSMIMRAREEGLGDMSNRRLIKLLRVMIIHRAYRYATRTRQNEPAELCLADLKLLPRYFIDHFHDDVGINKLTDMAEGP